MCGSWHSLRAKQFGYAATTCAATTTFSVSYTNGHTFHKLEQAADSRDAGSKCNPVCSSQRRAKWSILVSCCGSSFSFSNWRPHGRQHSLIFISVDPTQAWNTSAHFPMQQFLRSNSFPRLRHFLTCRIVL